MEPYIESESVGSRSSVKIDPDYIPTGTTNYIGCYFDEKINDRTILMDGGIPYHEFILQCNVFFEDYIRNGNINRTYYIFMTNSHTYNIAFELSSESIQDIRRLNVKEIIDEFKKHIKDTYYYFLGKNKYREDTSMTTLKRNYKRFNDEIYPKIETLLTK
jgi:hypothetical protein